MKKIPQPDELAPGEPVPVLPGTEEPRSLGDMLREAEEAQKATIEADAAREPSEAPPPRKQKQVNRAQSRRYARERALQALYQWDLGRAQSSDVRKQFLDGQDMSRVDVDYFVLLFNGVSHQPEPIDEALAEALDRPIGDLDPIERGVLRIATYELRECLDIPVRVIINEGIEITKRYGADKGHRYVNGVLDKLAASLRPLEMRQR